jgi:hypothetical protein
MAGVLANLIAFEDQFFDLMRNTFDRLHVYFIIQTALTGMT